MPENHSSDYEEGLRDGRILSLEKAVNELTVDAKKFKIALYMLYGAIALVQFLPLFKEFISHGQ
jgi:uncharacterized membrane protein